MSFTTATPELRAASTRFHAFFQELRGTFVEREDVLAQIALALLGREHVLMTGPPGTAKSGIAAAVLGRIVDEKTGRPSVFARQFTESTVQTDLVGPIDFKTLMATGRSEHFTDEGMLGAVHAFLDEVLDGRDMLLRTTLNVLQERELKQGTKTTRGLIECALMTTNRYLAEVLEGSRETLLAFVDRIAFIGFVPKGFSQSDSLTRVLRSQVGGARKPLKALLTVQDLDVLQDAADRVLVSDDALAALASMLGHLETELTATMKSDPSFAPTRYLSTRTAVRLARVLRSACVYDAIMHGERPEPAVGTKDFAMLRLSLLLSGPERAGIGKLLENESDPRERRQLSILRTEREIFERVLARVPAFERPAPKQVPSSVTALEAAVRAAAPQDDPKPLFAAAATLAQVADAGNAASPHAVSVLATTLALLSERALRAGTAAGAGPHQRSLDVVPELSTLADGIEAASGSSRPVARWLRGRAIQFLLDGAALAGTRVGEALDAETPKDLADVSRACDHALSALADMQGTCASLRAAGADEPEPHEHLMITALARVEDELVSVLDPGFRFAVRAALVGQSPDALASVLVALGPALAAIDDVDAKLAVLGGTSGALKARVVDPRALPLVRAAFDRVAGDDRLAIVEQVGALVEQLDRSGLTAVISSAELLRLAAGALVRGERNKAVAPARKPNHDGYRALRAAEQRVSLCYAIVEVALRVAPHATPATLSPEDLVGALASRIAALPEPLRAEIIELDLARIERAISLVHAWWRALASLVEGAVASGNGASLETALATLASSKYFHVTRDEGALLRFALESRVLGEVFPEATRQATELRASIDTLESESSAALATLRHGHAEAGWADVFETHA